MNKTFSILCGFCLMLLLGSYKPFRVSHQPVNAILGDVSYEAKFGQKPDETTNEVLRIQTHLEYVENVLRKRDVSSLDASTQRNRAKLLDLLHVYWTRGVFPQNTAYPDQRKPCFIDEEGNICAVGYLVQETAGRQVAESINAKHQYKELLAMNDAQVDAWVQTSGLTKEECAMIQPTYNFGESYIPVGYGLSSAFTSGLNVSLSILNTSQISKGARNRVAPILGLVAGTGQMILGTAKLIDEHKKSANLVIKNEKSNTLSMMNIGLGTSTTVLSLWNLLSNRKPKERLATWNIYNLPARKNSFGLAFHVARRF